MQESLFDTDPNESPPGTAVVAANKIPYGKLKGQPMDLLLTQPDYAIWLLTAKYSLLRKSHPPLLTWLLKTFGAPETTPEHNILQNRFLEPAFCRQLVAHLYPELERRLLASASQAALEGAWRVALGNSFSLSYSDYSLPHKHDFTSLLPDSHAKQREHALHWALDRLDRLKVVPSHDRVAAPDELVAFGLPAGAEVDPSIHRFWQPVINVANAEFEVEGADVQLRAKGSLSLDLDLPIADFRQLNQLFGFAFDKLLRVEVKPFVGDDYPVVLRNMVSTKCNVLLVEGFEADGASWEQATKVFASRSIRAVLLEDVLLTPVPDCFDRLPLLQMPRRRLTEIASDVLDQFDRQWLEKRRKSQERFG